MSIQRITLDNFEKFTIETNPSRSYSSRAARSGGDFAYSTDAYGNRTRQLDNTGSVYVFTYRSTIEKDSVILNTGSFTYADDSFESLRLGILQNTSSTDVETQLTAYMDAVSDVSQSARKQTKQEIIRTIPPFTIPKENIPLSKEYYKKTITTNHLMDYYRSEYPTSDFSFSNYHCLNFFENGSLSTDVPVPTTSALLYPNVKSSVELSTNVFDSLYGFRVGEPFTFDFWINPKYTVNNEGDDFKAGTILHLSGAYAISLLSGSSVDHNGKTDKFKLLLQLGTGSGLPPSQDAASDANRVYMSDDNILERNKWQHVTVRYGGTAYNYGSGSFIIDGLNKGDFNFNSPGFGLYNDTTSFSPEVLFVGNFYEGVSSEQAGFFNATDVTKQGLVQPYSIAGTTDPDTANYDLRHPLNAEIHDIKIYNKYLTLPEIEALDIAAPKTLDNLMFYLPPFFTEESPYRQSVGGDGGVLVTPYYEQNGTTKKPYEVSMSFGPNGHYVNLENYMRDFATSNFPRLWHLTGSAQTNPGTTTSTANAILYSTGNNAGSIKKRLYTVMPCDHGSWNPNFDFLLELSGATSRQYANDRGALNQGIVTLRNVASYSSDYNTMFYDEEEGRRVTWTELSELFGSTPNNVANDPPSGNSLLAQLAKFKNGDSNQVVLFDISNLFYGMQIEPGSLTLRETAMSGSDGKFGTIIRDDAYGNLYRADAIVGSGSHATWNSIGNIFYNEGIAIIKHPNYFFFGSEGFDIDFKGKQNLHTLTINAFAQPMQLLSSSNPSFVKALSASVDLANEPDQRYVWITSVLFHDSNLNVIARTKLAQPIMKKSGDRINFRTKIDF
jgi:hypothetical protein